MNSEEKGATTIGALLKKLSGEIKIEFAESFHVVNIPELTIETGLKMVLVAVACAAISIIFCIALQGVSKLYAKFLKNPYIRIVAASAIIIVIVAIVLMALHTENYWNLMPIVLPVLLLM